MTAAATVSHFSRGFVGTLTGDASDVEDAVRTRRMQERPTRARRTATVPQDATASQDASPFEGGAPAEGGLVESDSSVDVPATTFVSGLVQGAYPPAGTAVAIVVDEWSSAPDADGGCTGQVQDRATANGDQIPASRVALCVSLLLRRPFNGRLHRAVRTT